MNSELPLASGNNHLLFESCYISLQVWVAFPSFPYLYKTQTCTCPRLFARQLPSCRFPKHLYNPTPFASL